MSGLYLVRPKPYSLRLSIWEGGQKTWQKADTILNGVVWTRPVYTSEINIDGWGWLLPGACLSKRGVTDDRKSHYYVVTARNISIRGISLDFSKWGSFTALFYAGFFSPIHQKASFEGSLEWKPLAMTVMFDGYHPHHKRLLWLIESPFKSVSVACFYLLPRLQKRPKGK